MTSTLIRPTEEDSDGSRKRIGHQPKRSIEVAGASSAAEKE
jgi:hypothetical protein